MIDIFSIVTNIFSATLNQEKMDFIKGNNRNQMQFSSLKMNVREENPICFIDALVEQIDLHKLGFVMNKLQAEFI